MKVAIHQPNYLPWLGYFRKMSLADVFIILDTAQFTKNGYQNRVKIKTQQGAQWLTQPVRLADGAFRPTNQISFANNNWAKKHINTIRTNYGKAKFFNSYFPEFTNLLETAGDNLSKLNTEIIKWIVKILGFECPIYLASQCPSDLSSSERLIQLVQWVGGDTYLFGKGGENYQDDLLFQQAGIKLEVIRFNPAPYHQLWGEFLSGLSVIDLILNCGEESVQHIKNSDDSR